jgi:NPCBM/NEW2 domain/Domain of unknown function (DUF1929)
MNSLAFPRARNRLKPRSPWLALLAAGVLSGCGSTTQPLENPYLTQSHPWVDDGVQLTATVTSGFLSDQQWDRATNGWGPVERDRSNAESVAGDGRVLTINGQTFTKGLGTHAVSEITYSLAGNCSSFIATVGVDDEVDIQNRWGTVSFEVYGDTTKLFDSGVMSGTSPAQNISVNLTGRQSLRLVVTNGGDNVYYDHGDWAEARVTCGALHPVAALGRWDAPIAWPVVAIHASLLPNGKIITWDAGEQPTQVTKADLFDPVSGSHMQVPINNANIFCSGHTLLPDGRLLVAGGHLVNNSEGIAQTNLFDYRNNAWTRAQDMNAARWYPSVITLGSGEALVASGSITPDTFNEVPQVWGSQTGGAQMGGWRNLSGAQAKLPYYPWIFQAPDGRVFNSGPSTAMSWMTTTGTGTEVYAGNRDAVNFREYGSSVMYQPGKLLVIGGSDPPVASTTKIDLNLNAKLDAGPNMSFARRQLNATILPDGTVLVTGGTSGDGFNNEASAVLSAELWNPNTNTFRTLSSMQVARIYHSTVVLQPDGRVLSMGGGLGGGGINHPDAEYFNPPYLFNPDGTTATRPTISSAPATIGYNQAFTLGTPNASSISRVTLLRLTSVTHAFNMNQRFMDLSFSKASNGLSVTSPFNQNIAPPGHYLLSILNGNGVPSVSKVVQILAGTTPPNTDCAPPTVPTSVTDRMASLNATLWSYSTNQSVVSQCGTNVVKNTGTGTDFAATFLRKVALPGGSSVSMQFKLDSLAGDAYFSLASSGATYQRFGLVELGGRLYGQGYLGDGNWIGVPLSGQLKIDTWYELKFNTTGPLFTLEVRERGLGAPIASFSKAMGSGRTWYFQHWLNQGSAYFANYAETSSGTGGTGGGTPGSLYRAINLNGPNLIIEGKTFEASAQAADLVAGPYSFVDERVALNPAVTDVNKAKMLHSSIFGYGTVGGQVKLSNVPIGNYNVYLYAWEDDLNETFSLKLNGLIVESNYQSGPAGTWRKLGPYTVNVTAGSIEMSSSGGAANFSGLEIYRQ